MRTPIDDFVRAYDREGVTRLHMPGHKGCGELERFDITEIYGADSLFEAKGIIRESEENAGRLFGAHTLYSTEGSSLCIRAMLFLALQAARAKGCVPRLLAARGAHKVLVSAAALLDLPIDWLYPTAEESYLSCTVHAEDVRAYIAAHGAPTALYLTSPDYLGNRQDVRTIAEVCHAHGTLLLVDNAHGAYLAFLEHSEHPIALGADMCCDSAHKTLPVLTGGAYLHIRSDAPALLHEGSRDAMAQFASTSPSYLILASLDRANRYLADGYPARLARCIETVGEVRKRLCAHGYSAVGDEPMKLTLRPKPYGYTGEELASYVRERGFECEFADADHTVFMPTPDTGDAALFHLLDVLLSLPRRAARTDVPPQFAPPTQVMSARDAMLAHSEVLPTEQCLGRVLSAATVGCPPAVPILVSGEPVDEHALSMLRYYGIQTLRVVCEE